MTSNMYKLNITFDKIFILIIEYRNYDINVLLIYIKDKLNSYVLDHISNLYLYISDLVWLLVCTAI